MRPPSRYLLPVAVAVAVAVAGCTGAERDPFPTRDTFSVAASFNATVDTAADTRVVVTTATGATLEAHETIDLDGDRRNRQQVTTAAGTFTSDIVSVAGLRYHHLTGTDPTLPVDLVAEHPSGWLAAATPIPEPELRTGLATIVSRYTPAGLDIDLSAELVSRALAGKVTRAGLADVAARAYTIETVPTAIVASDADGWRHVATAAPTGTVWLDDHDRIVQAVLDVDGGTPDTTWTLRLERAYAGDVVDVAAPAGPVVRLDTDALAALDIARSVAARVDPADPHDPRVLEGLTTASAGRFRIDAHITGGRIGDGIDITVGDAAACVVLGSSAGTPPVRASACPR